MVRLYVKSSPKRPFVNVGGEIDANLTPGRTPRSSLNCKKAPQKVSTKVFGQKNSALAILGTYKSDEIPRTNFDSHRAGKVPRKHAKNNKKSNLMDTSLFT